MRKPSSICGRPVVELRSGARWRLPMALAVSLLALLVSLAAPPAAAGTFPLGPVIDQTPAAPLSLPTPGTYEARYLSGFGGADAFTILFEDRAAGSAIEHNSTSAGPTGFAASNVATNVSDTHFLVKDWPVTLASPPPGTCGQVVDQVTFPYRAWASVDNTPDHHFYVSNDLTCWILVSTFTIPNDAAFANARGFVYYGFHDVTRINGTYYAWGESNQGQTMVLRSTSGGDVWEAFASVGGTEASDGPLQMPEAATPSGSFFDLGADRGIGKLHVRGNDGAFFLAVNTAASMSLAPEELEAAFLDPANWTWHDGTTGLPASPILEANAAHDLREAWVVPPADPAAGSWTILYTADFGSPYGKALGYAEISPVPVELMRFSVR